MSRAGYRGADRRAGARTVSRGSAWFAVWSLPAVVGGGALAAFLVATGSSLVVDPWLLALGAWSTLCFGAGVAMLVAWRVGGLASLARLGVATVSAAALVTVVPRLTQAVGEPGGMPAIRPLVIAAVLMGAGACSARALHVPAVDTTLRPLRELVVLLAVTLVALLAAELAMATGLLQDVAAVRALPVAACAVTTGWMTLAGAWSRSPRTRALVASWALLAAAFWAHSRSAPSQDVVAAVLLATSASLLVALSLDALRTALAVHDLRSLQTLAALAERSDDALRAREVRHDALNALASICSASDVLASRSGALDEATRRDLVDAARAELTRVQRLLGPDGDADRPPQGPRQVRRSAPLVEALDPLLQTWRRRGLHVDVHPSLAVTASDAWQVEPDAVCRIVDNLLQNVHRHGRGAAVRLSAQRAGADVVLHVSDDGPGIADDLRSGLFAPSVVGPAGMRGQGIGLAAARRLARRLGGDLELVTSRTGTRFALTLPADDRRAVVEPARRAG